VDDILTIADMVKDLLTAFVTETMSHGDPFFNTFMIGFYLISFYRQTYQMPTSNGHLPQEIILSKLPT